MRLLVNSALHLLRRPQFATRKAKNDSNYDRSHYSGEDLGCEALTLLQIIRIRLFALSIVGYLCRLDSLLVLSFDPGERGIRAKNRCLGRKF